MSEENPTPEAPPLPEDPPQPAPAPVLPIPAPRLEARKPVEQWAQEKGHGTVTFGKPARTKPAPGAWKFLSARALEGWIQGRELTEAQYDAAIERAAGMKVS